MRYWRTLILVNGIIVSFILPGTQAWAGEKVTKGSSWVITGKIDVPSDKASISFQDGRPVNSMSSNQYSPWCKMSFNTRDKQKRTFNKGSFEITKASNDEEYVTDSVSSFKTVMILKSAQVPDVNRLVCGSWGDQSDDFLTIKQIRQAMEGIMKLELKAGK